MSVHKYKMLNKRMHIHNHAPIPIVILFVNFDELYPKHLQGSMIDKDTDIVNSLNT